MNYNRALFRLTQKILTMLLARANLQISHKSLLTDSLVPRRDRTLLRNVSLRIHRNDGMYLPASGRHYFGAGLSAWPAATIAGPFGISSISPAGTAGSAVFCGPGSPGRPLRPATLTSRPGISAPALSTPGPSGRIALSAGWTVIILQTVVSTLSGAVRF